MTPAERALLDFATENVCGGVSPTDAVGKVPGLLDFLTKLTELSSKVHVERGDKPVKMHIFVPGCSVGYENPPEAAIAPPVS